MNSSSGQGMKNGLSLLLDYQDELSLQAFPHPKEEKSKKVIENLNFDTDRYIHRAVARVAELGGLSSGAKMAMKNFVKRVFTIFASNASFLRVIANLQN